MIRLISNELSKIIHKKTIIIYSLIVLALVLTISVASKKSESLFLDNQSYEEVIKVFENEIASYNLKDPGQYEAYKDAKASIMVNQFMQEYTYDSWKANYIENKTYDLCYDYVTADLNQEVENATEIKNQIDAILKEIRNNDFNYFMKKEQTENKKEMQNLLNLGYSKSSEEYLTLKYKDEGYNYKINLISDPDTTYSKKILSLVTEYEESKLQVTINKDTKKNFEAKTEYNNYLSKYEESKYKLDNKLFNDDSTSEQIESKFSSASFYVVIAIIIIASSIMAEEFNKGTIKQLLLKPFSRSKIYYSKFLTMLIVLIAFILYYIGINVLIDGIIFGFDHIQNVVVYNSTANLVKSYNIIEFCLIKTLAFMPCYIIIALFSYVISIITKNGALSSTGSIVAFFASLVVDGYLYGSNLKIVRFIPSCNWDLSGYLFGNIGNYQKLNFSYSIGIDIFIIIALILLGNIWFKKTDIKNQ